MLNRLILIKLLNSPHILQLMTSENFKKWNLILGWTTLQLHLITYSLTLEPTVSAWDCGEYISTSVKLEVGHPPGAPLFQMLGAFFAMFTSEY